MRTVEPKRHSAEARSKIFSFIRDRFLRDDMYRESQLAIGWSKETCMKMYKLAQEDHSYVALRRERERYESMWAFSQRSSGSQTSATHDRGDCPAVVIECRNSKNCDACARVYHSTREDFMHPADWPGETWCVKT